MPLITSRAQRRLLAEAERPPFVSPAVATNGSDRGLALGLRAWGAFLERAVRALHGSSLGPHGQNRATNQSPAEKV